VTARTVLQPADITRALTRISHEILESNRGGSDLVLLGIPTRGVVLAKRIGAILESIEPGSGVSGSLDVTMYRDDLAGQPTRAPSPTQVPADGIDGKTVVLVDDVLYSGRTIRAALDALADHGRPRAVRLAVLVDRGHRELPIRADFVGKNLPTSADEKIRVRLDEVDGFEGGDRVRHLLSTKDLDLATAVGILDVAEDMADVATREVKKLPTLRGRTVINLFFEDSTRTRTSFELAAKRLSADLINFSAKGSSVSKGEGLKDTAQTLAAMGADAVVIRHSASGAAQVLAQSDWIDAAILNAGDGTHEHPTQALLDAYTMRKRLHGDASRGRNLDGLNVTIVGDILHSRVARSNVWLLTTLGAHVTLVAPATLLPSGIRTWPVSIGYDLESAVDDNPDVVMMLRIQAERMHAAFCPNTREYSREWGLDDERVARLRPDTMVMHPGPMVRGLEISAAAADSSRSTVLEQVANGVSIRMAVLYLLLAGEGAQS
jgi:aspartate carbamoyltransferase catalytic subunit